MNQNSDNNIARSESRRIGLMAEWCRRHLGVRPLAFIVATVIGLTAGLGAFLLKRAIDWLSKVLTSGLNAMGPDWLLVLLPVIGIVLTGILCRYVFRSDLSHGVRQLKQALKVHDYRRPASLMYSPLIASTITLGFGGSAGSEGPIAAVGAAIGSNIARVFRLDSHTMMIMLGCGAGAGIAGIFTAPIGGALFTLEVLRMSLTTYTVTLLLVSTLTAAMTAFLLSGCTVDIAISHVSTFDASLIGWVILLGIACGIYSLYYSYIVKRVEHLLNAIASPWVRNCLAGLALGLMFLLFPSLYGEGYGVIGHLINGNFSALTVDSIFAADGSGGWLMAGIAAGVVALKCFATSATNSGGGVSGEFAPTLFAGSVMGYLFAVTANLFFDASLPVPLFAYLGLAGVMAGVIRAPLMAIFLTFELTGAYGLLLPLTITGAISFGTVRLYNDEDFYALSIELKKDIEKRLKNRIDNEKS